MKLTGTLFGAQDDAEGDVFPKLDGDGGGDDSGDEATDAGYGGIAPPLDGGDDSGGYQPDRTGSESHVTDYGGDGGGSNPIPASADGGVRPMEHTGGIDPGLTRVGDWIFDGEPVSLTRVIAIAQSESQDVLSFGVFLDSETQLPIDGYLWLVGGNLVFDKYSPGGVGEIDFVVIADSPTDEFPIFVVEYGGYPVVHRVSGTRLMTQMPNYVDSGGITDTGNGGTGTAGGGGIPGLHGADLKPLDESGSNVSTTPPDFDVTDFDVGRLATLDVTISYDLTIWTREVRSDGGDLGNAAVGSIGLNTLVTLDTNLWEFFDWSNPGNPVLPEVLVFIPADGGSGTFNLWDVRLPARSLVSEPVPDYDTITFYISVTALRGLELGSFLSWTASIVALEEGTYGYGAPELEVSTPISFSLAIRALGVGLAGYDRSAANALCSVRFLTVPPPPFNALGTVVS